MQEGAWGKSPSCTFGEGRRLRRASLNQSLYLAVEVGLGSVECGSPEVHNDTPLWTDAWERAAQGFADTAFDTVTDVRFAQGARGSEADPRSIDTLGIKQKATKLRDATLVPSS